MEDRVGLGALITPRPGIESTTAWSKVQHPNRCAAKTPWSLILILSSLFISELDFAIARSRVRLPPVAAVYQRLLSVPSLRGRLISSSLRGEGLVRLIGAVVCLLCCAAGPLVRYRGQWMAAYRATVSSAHANQLPLPGLWSAAVRVNHL